MTDHQVISLMAAIIYTRFSPEETDDDLNANMREAMERAEELWVRCKLINPEGKWPSDDE